MRGVLNHPTLDPAFKELVLLPPSEIYVAEQLESVDPQRVHAAREAMRMQLAQALRDDWAAAFEAHQVTGGYSADPISVGKRALANLALSMLCLDAVARGDTVWPGRAYQRFKDAGNMTDRQGALWALLASHSELAEPALARFYELFKGEPLVIDKWFTLQAMLPEAATLARVKDLTAHKAFSMGNPNRVRSLIGAFAQGNQTQFNRADGAGYGFLAEQIIDIDKRNPQVAARILTSMRSWRSLEDVRAGHARYALLTIDQSGPLSTDVRDLIDRMQKG